MPQRPKSLAWFIAVTMVSPIPCAQADLVAHYRFDDTSGTVATESVAANHATWVPGAATPDWQPDAGRIGGSVLLPGSGSHVNYFEIASVPEINGAPAGMTIALWFKPTGDSGYRGIVMSRDVDGGVFGIGHEDDHLDGRVDGGSADSAGGTLAASDDWFHIAWVWDNSQRTQRLYIDGVEEASRSGLAMQTITANSDWRIGDDECCSNRNLDGYLDDLGIWDEPLSAAQIAALHANGLAGFGIGESPPRPVTEPLDVGLVINEIHYDPEPKTEFVEFVELLNTGPDPIDLGGYRFSRGIDFVFPPGTMLDVTEYLLVGEDTAALGQKYADLPQTFQYAGSLSNDGEVIELIDGNGTVVDRVDYRNAFPWPVAANGEGASMQLVNGTLDNDLGGAWRPELPTPGYQNSVFAENAPPQMRQVEHTPQQPTSSETTTVSVKATDPDGVAGVTLHYQINAPGAFVPAFLPLPRGTLQSSPETPLSPNPAFAQDWIDLPMTADATGEIFTATIPAQPHRTLVRYRLTASDTMGNGIRAPFADDPSLNFAAFSYDGVPDYVEDNGTVHTAATLTALPVYHLITDPSHFAQCWAYDSADRVGSVAARKKFNWEGAFVYEGKVYDHVEYRLRQRNDRYAGEGRRSMKFRFRRGNEFAARDPEGDRYPAKWRRLNTGKMSRFSGATNFGMRELISSRLWNLAGVLAPEFQHVHFRVIDDAAEAPDEHLGDFFGLALVYEDVDAQFVANRNLDPGNIYKLKDGESNPFELRKYQARAAVSDGSDFVNIRDNLGPPQQSNAWLRDHVDWDAWYLYAALGEGFRHYDFSPYFEKNRIWYFRPEAGTPFGLMSVIPHDTDGTWRRGTNDGQWDDPRWGPGTGFRGRVVGVDLPKEAIQEVTGLDGTDGENHPERPAFMLEYRNVLREVRDLFWQPETVNTVIDAERARIAPLEGADRARWVGGPPAAGTDNYANTMLNQAAQMKTQAFMEELYMGESLAGGRSEWLRRLAEDPAVPDKPTISYAGAAGFPAGGLVLATSPFSDPQGAGTFGKMEWRIAEVTAPMGQDVALISNGDTWRFLDDGSDQGAAWRELAFDDGSWPGGPGQFGFGEGDEATLLNTSPKPLTAYFRKAIAIPDPAVFESMTISAIRDDGIAVYVNGVEVLRDNLAPGAGYLTPAESSLAGAAEFQPAVAMFSAELLQPGDNVIAVEVHNHHANGSDLSFDLAMTASAAAPEPKHEWHATWESGELDAFHGSVRPPAAATRAGRNYRARVRHADSSGRWSHWSDPLEFTASLPDISLFTASLVINEIMYHPSDPTPAEIAAGYDDDDFFEYVEIRNVGTQTIDLGDVRFTKGVDFDFGGGAIASIAPGGYVLVVEHEAAFAMRYGAGLPVAGAWSGKLDNGGEQLKLSFGAGEAIRDFVYDDVAPWPTSPDGSGFSLVLVDPLGLPDHGDPLNWRASAAAGGTPGGTDGMTFQGGDLLLYATGGVAPTVESLPDGSLAFKVPINRLAEDLIGEVQVSDDLVTWQSAGAPARPFSVQLLGNGYADLSFSIPGAIGGSPLFVRYAVGVR